MLGWDKMSRILAILPLIQTPSCWVFLLYQKKKSVLLVTSLSKQTNKKQEIIGQVGSFV